MILGRENKAEKLEDAVERLCVEWASKARLR